MILYTCQADWWLITKENEMVFDDFVNVIYLFVEQ